MLSGGQNVSAQVQVRWPPAVSVWEAQLKQTEREYRRGLRRRLGQVAVPWRVLPWQASLQQVSPRRVWSWRVLSQQASSRWTAWWQVGETLWRVPPDCYQGCHGAVAVGSGWVIQLRVGQVCASGVGQRAGMADTAYQLP